MPWKGSPDQSPTVRTTGTLKPYSCQDNGTEGCLLLQSGTTCDHLRPMSFLPQLILSGEVFPVRTLAAQDLERAWTESDQDSFSNYSALLASASPDSSSWRTCQQSLLPDLIDSSWSSMRWGMMRGGQLSQPQKWEPRTSENDGSCLPTLTAKEGGYNRGGGAGRVGRIRPTLSTLVREVSNRDGERLEGQREGSEFAETKEPKFTGKGRWAVEPDVDRVVHGLPNRVDRIRGLGNAVVPAQAKEAFMRLSGLHALAPTQRGSE